jgi:hypothetical protein
MLCSLAWTKEQSMANKALKTVPKISVKIWRPLIEKFDEKVDAACLRRDAYLAKLLQSEIEWLDQEVPVPNSEASYDYVFDKLDQFDRKLVSLALPAELSARINAVCAKKRIVRDAFFNRLFLLLSASPKVIDKLFFGTYASEWRAIVWSECKHDGPFFQSGFYPLEPMIDPFWAIRTGLEIFKSEEGVEYVVDHESGGQFSAMREVTGDLRPADSVYSMIFDEKIKGHELISMSCSLPDWRVPGQPAEQKYRARLDEIFADL